MCLLGHRFKSDLCCVLTGTSLSILLYVAYEFYSDKKGLVPMLISSILNFLANLGTSSVAQQVEQGAS